MTLTVEDGSVVAGADSYVATADYQAYGSARGWTLEGGDNGDEINLRRAFDAINRIWSYPGTKVNAAQTGAFPRTSFTLIPSDIKNAQMELAYLIQGGLDPFASIEQGIGEVRAGPVSVKYDFGGADSERLVAVEGLLAPYLKYSGSQRGLVRA